MTETSLPYRVVDMRYHLDGDYQILFASNERWEAIAAAKESGGGMTVIKVNEDGFEQVVFINTYLEELGLSV